MTDGMVRKEGGVFESHRKLSVFLVGLGLNKSLIYCFFSHLFCGITVVSFKKSYSLHP